MIGMPPSRRSSRVSESFDAWVVVAVASNQDNGTDEFVGRFVTDVFDRIGRQRRVELLLVIAVSFERSYLETTRVAERPRDGVECGRFRAVQHRTVEFANATQLLGKQSTDVATDIARIFPSFNLIGLFRMISHFDTFDFSSLTLSFFYL